MWSVRCSEAKVTKGGGRPRHVGVVSRPEGLEGPFIPLRSRASWMRTPSRPTCSSSIARVPWRSRRENRGHDDRAGEREDAPNCTMVDLTGGASANSDQDTPPLDNGTRTWAELVGLLDPMNESEQLIAPVVLESAVERLRGMNDEERRGVAINLVRFLAVFYAEILQMLHMAAHGDESGEREVQDSDREWCFQQWGVLREPLMARTKTDVQESRDAGNSEAASSSDIVHVADSQESQEEGQSAMVAVLQNGTIRPLTAEEHAEVAYHEELEQRAAEDEARMDERRWSLFRAQSLQDEEDATMKAAMAEDEEEPPRKKARVKVVVEGEGGRVVRSEVFNLVVKDGESLTYKIMVLPKDDPEVSALRRLQEQRQREQEEGDASNASAEVPVDPQGRALPDPVQVPEPELEAFMKTPEGELCYQKWLTGEITCKMVRVRSGAGLLAKFCGRKVDDEEEAKMMQAVLSAESDLHQSESRGSSGDIVAKAEKEGKVVQEMSKTKPPDADVEPVGVLHPPRSWPSFTMMPCSGAAQSEGQGEGQ